MAKPNRDDWHETSAPLVRRVQAASLRAVFVTAVLVSLNDAAATTAERPEATEASERLAEVETYEIEYAKREGKEALIAQYQALLDEFPSDPLAPYIHSRIAQVYEWDLSKYGAPPDPEIAIDVYASILDRYPSDAYYMREVTLLAADRAHATDNAALSSHYFNLALERYPDDDALRLRCYKELGDLAMELGDFSSADQYFASTMAFDLTAVSDEEQRQEMSVTMHNATVSLLSLAVSYRESAESQLARLEAMIKRFPQIELWNLDGVNALREDLKETQRADEARKNGALNTTQPEMRNALSEVGQSPRNLGYTPSSSTRPKPKADLAVRDKPAFPLAALGHSPWPWIALCGLALSAAMLVPLFKRMSRR